MVNNVPLYPIPWAALSPVVSSLETGTMMEKWTLRYFIKMCQRCPSIATRLPSS